jgi:hypothetical protein
MTKEFMMYLLVNRLLLLNMPLNRRNLVDKALAQVNHDVLVNVFYSENRDAFMTDLICHLEALDNDFIVD